MQKTITKRQKQLLSIIYKYIEGSGYPPTFEEMREELAVASNQSIVDLLEKLKKQGYIKKSEAEARGIAILPAGYQALQLPQLIPFLGTTTAGAPVQVVEIQGEWQKVSSDVARLQDDVFLLKISGDSMINARINDGDIVLVKSQKSFFTNDIVLAEVDGESTVKRFISQDTPPYTFLKPENPTYDIILFKNNVKLKGKILSVLKNGVWYPVH